MAKEEFTKIMLADGQMILGKEIKFEVVKEDFNEYKTENGYEVKQKTVVGKMFVQVDENGNEIPTPEGDPNIITRSANLIYTSK
jgi:hypothetical protein